MQVPIAADRNTVPPITGELTIRPEFHFQKSRVIANKNCLNTNYRFDFGITDNTIIDNTYSVSLQIVYQLHIQSIRMSFGVLCTFV